MRTATHGMKTTRRQAASFVPIAPGFHVQVAQHDVMVPGEACDDVSMGSFLNCGSMFQVPKIVRHPYDKKRALNGILT